MLEMEETKQKKCGGDEQPDLERIFDKTFKFQHPSDTPELVENAGLSNYKIKVSKQKCMHYAGLLSKMIHGIDELKNSLLGKLLIKILLSYNTSLTEFEQNILQNMKKEESRCIDPPKIELNMSESSQEMPNEFMVSTPNKKEQFISRIIYEDSVKGSKTERKRTDNVDTEYLEALKSRKKIMALKGSDAGSDLKKIYADLRDQIPYLDLEKDDDFFDEHQEIIDSFKVSGDEFQWNHEENVRKYIENLKKALKTHTQKKMTNAEVQTSDKFVHISELKKLNKEITRYKQEITDQQVELRRFSTKKNETDFMVYRLEEEKATLSDKVEELRVILNAMKIEKSTMMDKFIAIEKVMRMIKDTDLNGYRRLIVEVCKNESSDDRREYFSTKAKEEGIKYKDPYKKLMKRLKEDTEIRVIVKEEKPLMMNKRLQTRDAPTMTNFTQTPTIKTGIKTRRFERESSCSLSKIVRQTSIVPQTYRGGGFLHYSRSIETDEVISPALKPSYEDHQCLAQNSKPSGQLILNHPKMKGDNMIKLIKHSGSFKKMPVKARRIPGDLKHINSMKTPEVRMGPGTFYSLFSKESFQGEDCDQIIDSLGSSHESSNIQIDKYYTIDKEKDSNIIKHEDPSKIITCFRKETSRPTTARAVILKNRKRSRKRPFHSKKRKLCKTKRA
ncbi:unnamed protein product [Moneuplotes crassus]|uniref:Uncharacterized protein n=1 Tax=Euplotes crassus TaxID=5936 RepID=A0AAD2DAS7_EUPCR|nr:unnamed protein product [Moneuplotes crassus]